MKRTLSLILSLALALSACWAAAEEERENSYFFGENVYGILNTGERALADGMDPKWVLEEMKKGAEEMECEDAFTSICENIAAYGGKDYQKIAKVLGDEEPLRDLDIDNPARSRIGKQGWTVYDRPEVSDAMADMLSDPTAEYCFEAGWWGESEFQSVFGVSYQKFQPSRPRPGYVCVIVRKGAQRAPETAWDAAGDREYRWDFPLYRAVGNLVWGLGEDAPVLTGNPHLASVFWVFDLSYPFYASYGSEGQIKGYNCKTSLTVETAAKKEKIAEISASEELGSTIYSWSDGVAQADVPNFEDADAYDAFLSSVRLALLRERSAAAENQPVTARNVQKRLDGLLLGLAEKASDPWEAAIYEGGARDVSWDEGIVTFRLRSFDPGLDEMSPYQNREDSFGWLSSAFSSAENSEIETSLKVFTGVFTHSSQTSMKKAVSAAAQKAKAAFESKDMKQAVQDWLFLSPTDGKVRKADDLLHPNTSFTFWASDLAEHLSGYLPEGALSSLFYAQKYQRLNTAGGPNALTLQCAGADPARLLSDTAKTALDQLAYSPASARYDGSWYDLFLETLAKTALDEKDQGSYTFTIPINLSQNKIDDLPAKYLEYLKAFRYGDVLEQFQNTADKLPSMAAQALPSNGRLSGGRSGTQVNLEVTEKSSPTYVQIRKDSNGQIAATAFVHPGKSVTVYIPSGSYRIYYCSGPYWYGEEEMFSALGSYQKSEPTQIKGTNYYHTFTLETVQGGTTEIYPADPSEFRE